MFLCTGAMKGIVDLSALRGCLGLMERVCATEDLLIAGRPYPSFPILLWNTMILEWSISAQKMGCKNSGEIQLCTYAVFKRLNGWIAMKKTIMAGLMAIVFLYLPTANSKAYFGADGSIVIDDPIEIYGTYYGPHRNLKGERSDIDDTKNKAKEIEIKKENARLAAIEKATAEEKLRSEEAKQAAHELLLRLGDEPLANDGAMVEKVWDAISDTFLTPQISVLLKTLTPAQFGQSWLDLAKTKQEVLGARYLIQKDADDAAKAKQLKSENEKALGLPPSGIEVKPDSQEEERFFKAMRSIASAKSDDTGFVVDQLISRGRKSSENPIRPETVKLIAKKLAPLTPPNSCVVAPGKWACPMDVGVIGGACGCPGIGDGKAGLRQVSEFCSGAISNCRLNQSLPIGTPCNCDADFQHIKGPIPWGRIVKRPISN